jgi:hypothetical protein
MKKIFLLLLPVFLLCPPLTEAKTQTAKVAVDISAGQYKAVRLKNLPRDSVVKVEIKCDGTVTVLFATEEQYKEYPNMPRPLFLSTVRDHFTFTVTIPARGNYHLVFDNKTGSGTVKLDAIITGASGSDKELQRSRRSEQGGPGSSDLASIGRELSALFVFKPFTIPVRKCDGRRAPSNGSEELAVCVEYAKSLSDTLGPQKASIALLFSLYHEAGHILLSQWDYPFSDHEDIANEFAAMVFALSGRRDELSGLMEQLRAGTQTGDLLAGKFKGRLHSLSREQAANIGQWVKDDQRLKEWQKIFVPRMQTAMLERVRKDQPVWADQSRVKKELAIRKQTVF